MAIEPVNERPIFPQLVRADSSGVGQWTTSMIRQLTTVFQQYGFRLNQALLEEQLDTEGGEIVTINSDPVLRDSDLGQNGGNLAELDQSNTFTADQVLTGGDKALQLKSNGTVDHVYLEFYARDVDLAARSAYIGYSTGGATTLRIDNAIGSVDLRTAAGDVLSATASGNVLTAGSLWLGNIAAPTTEATELFLQNHGLTVRTTDNEGDYIFQARSSGQAARFTVQHGTGELKGNYNAGWTIGTPTGGAQGINTLNATALYDDGSLLTDYVFDAALDGKVDPDWYDQQVPEIDDVDPKTGQVKGRKRARPHRPARDFCGCLDELEPEQYAAKWKETRKLPAIARYKQRLSIGELSQALMETCEVQAVHIDRLVERVKTQADTLATQADKIAAQAAHIDAIMARLDALENPDNERRSP